MSMQGMLEVRQHGAAAAWAAVLSTARERLPGCAASSRLARHTILDGRAVLLCVDYSQEDARQPPLNARQVPLGTLFVLGKRGTKRVLEYARLAMGLATARASRYGIR